MAEQRKSTAVEIGTNEIIITRLFDAPRALVWKAWTDPKHFKRWYGPKGFSAPIVKIELRVGGKHHWCMRGPDGKDLWSVGIYREIVPMERIVYTDSLADEHGNAVPMPEDWPSESLVTVTFEELGGKTKMTLRHTGLPEGMQKFKEMVDIVWNEAFDKLAESLQ